MADNTDTLNLAAMASLKGTLQSGGPDRKTQNASAKATDRVGFDGLLKTFLGRDEDEKRGFRTGKSRKSSGSSEKSSKRMDSDQKKALCNSMKKTVPSEGAELTPEELAVAAEAASLIWNLLYGVQMAVPGMGGTSVGRLASMLGHLVVRPGALGSVSVAGLDAGSIEDAVETANASAEMNSAAVLSSLDGMLDGMSREALARALNAAAAAGGMGGIPNVNVFDQLVAALDAEITGISYGEDPLAALRGDAAVILGGRSLTAENAGAEKAVSEIDGLISQFLGGRVAGQGAAGDDGNAAFASIEEAAVAFTAWYGEQDNTGVAKELSAEAGTIADALARALGIEGGKSGREAAASGKDAFSPQNENVERSLHYSADSDTGGRGKETGQEFPGGQTTSAAFELPPSSAHAEGTGTSGTTAMLDQIENIQRLAEAMRLASRGGVKNLTMQLSPPELGKVMLRVESRDGVVSAHLRVEKSEAAHELANNLAQLRDNLKAQGIELGELSIHHMQKDELLGDFGDGQRHRESFPAESGLDSRNVREREEAAEEVVAPIAFSASGDGSVNLIA